MPENRFIGAAFLAFERGLYLVRRMFLAWFGERARDVSGVHVG
jgi:hypothetical protein